MEDMADFFDNLMRDAKKTAARVADRTMATANIAKNKTLETVDCVKLEIEMKKVQGNLDKEYQVLGQIVYQIERGKLNRDDQILQAACKRIDHCVRQLEELENKKRGKKNYIIINAEGIGDSNRLAKRIETATGIETRATILGHIQRGGSPTAKDRVYASTMGAYAVDLLSGGATNRVIAYKAGQFTDFDIDEALAMKKTIDEYQFLISRLMVMY